MPGKITIVDHDDCGAYKLTYKHVKADQAAELHQHQENFAQLRQVFHRDTDLSDLEIEGHLYSLSEQRLVALDVAAAKTY